MITVDACTPKLNVEFDKIEKLKDPVKARMKNLRPLPRCDR
jgi:hypothetical protein